MKTDDIAKVARFWNRIAHDFDTIYSGEKPSLQRWLDRWLRRDIYERFAWVMREAGDVGGTTVCDIGCGSGRFVSALAERGAERVVGVDVAPEMLSLARELARRAGVLARCELVQGDVLDWTPREKFDLTLAVGVWDYLANPSARLRVIRAITRGKFLSTWPRCWTWRMPVRKARLTLQGCPVYFFRRPQVYGYLQDAGFRVESCEVVGKLYCVVARPS